MICSNTLRPCCSVADGGKRSLHIRNQPSINKNGVSSSIVFFTCMAMLVSAASAFSVPLVGQTPSGRTINPRYMSSNLIADNEVASTEDPSSMTLNEIDTMLLEKVKDTSIHMIQHHQNICQFHDDNAIKIKRTLSKMSPDASFATTLKTLREHRFPSQHAEDEPDTKIDPVKSPFAGQTPTSSYLDALSQKNIDGSDLEGFDNHDGQNKNNDDPLILVDVSAYLHQVYYSMPPLFRKDGMPINAVLAFCNMLNHLILERLLKGEQPRVALVFDPTDGASFAKDGKIGRNFRQDIHPKYKSERLDVPVDLLLQLALIQDVAVAFGIPQLMASHKYEADDVIATLTATSSSNKNLQPPTVGSGDEISIRNVYIVSGDSDLMQLVSTNHEAVEHHCHMIHPITLENIDEQAVLNKWGVPASKLGDMMALVGKGANGIPGVPGIGQKIAAELITEHGSLEELYQGVVFIKQTKRREKLINFEAQAKLSRELLQLDRNVPLDDIVIVKGEHPAQELQSLDDLKMEAMDAHRILDLYSEMGFSDIRYRVRSP